MTLAVRMPVRTSGCIREHDDDDEDDEDVHVWAGQSLIYLSLSMHTDPPYLNPNPQDGLTPTLTLTLCKP